MYLETKEQHEKRAGLMTKYREIADTERTLLEKGETLPDDKRTESDNIYKDIEGLDESIERQERALEMKKKDIEELAKKSKDEGKSEDELVNQDEEAKKLRGIKNKDYSRALRNYLCASDANSIDPKDMSIIRAQSTTDSAGGYMISEDMFTRVEKALLFFGGMRQASNVIQTSTGDPLQMPNYNDTGNTGALIAENAVDSEQDITFGNLELNAWSYTSKIIRVSRQLLQDSLFDTEGIIGDALGERIGRITNTHYTTGSAASRPNGVVTASTSGVTAASATVIAANEYFDLMHSVDPDYRKNPSSVWMFNDTTLKVIRKLADSQNQYLWRPGLTQDEPDTFLGHRYIINQDVASIAANAKAVLFGDFSKYFIRDVLPITLRRSDDRYFEYNQIAFVAWMRTDGDLQNAGTNPIKFITNPAS